MRFMLCCSHFALQQPLAARSALKSRAGKGFKMQTALATQTQKAEPPDPSDQPTVFPTSDTLQSPDQHSARLVSVQLFSLSHPARSDCWQSAVLRGVQQPCPT